jgi:hypothetical protein
MKTNNMYRVNECVHNIAIKTHNAKRRDVCNVTQIDKQTYNACLRALCIARAYDIASRFAQFDSFATMRIAMRDVYDACAKIVELTRNNNVDICDDVTCARDYFALLYESIIIRAHRLHVHFYAQMHEIDVNYDCESNVDSSCMQSIFEHASRIVSTHEFVTTTYNRMHDKFVFDIT